MVKLYFRLSLLKIILIVNGVLIVFYGEKDSISRPTWEETGGTNVAWERRFAS